MLTEIAESMGTIPGTTICGLADGAAWPIKNAIPKIPRRLRAVHPERPQNGGRGHRVRN